jgi:hypothetical protein
MGSTSLPEVIYVVGTTLFPKGDDVFYNLVVYKVYGAFDLDNRLIGSDGMIAVLEVKGRRSGERYA